MRWNLQRHGPRIVQHDLGSEGAVHVLSGSQENPWCEFPGSSYIFNLKMSYINLDWF